MDAEIEIAGRPVSFHLQYGADSTRGRELRPTSTAQVGLMVAEAIAGALHYTLAATVYAVTMVIARTATLISIELEDERTRKRIQLQVRTARSYSDALLEICADDSWNHEVKADLVDSLKADLRDQLRRIRS